MKTRELISKSQARAIEDIVESWKLNHQDALWARDIEDVLSLGLYFCEQINIWAKSLWKEALAGNVANLQAEGESMLRVIELGRKWVPEVRPLIGWAAGKGHQIHNSQRLDEAIAGIDRLKTAFVERWPFVNEDQITQARSDFALGQYQTAEEVLRELQGAHPG